MTHCAINRHRHHHSMWIKRQWNYPLWTNQLVIHYQQPLHLHPTGITHSVTIFVMRPIMSLTNPLWTYWHQLLANHHLWTNWQRNHPLWSHWWQQEQQWIQSWKQQQKQKQKELINQHPCLWLLNQPTQPPPLQLWWHNVRNLLQAKWLFFELGWKNNQICPLLQTLIIWTI